MKPGERIVALFATGFYTGYFPFAPATFSTLVLGIPFYLLCSRLSIYWYVILLLSLIVLAVELSDRAEKFFGKIDCGFIVIDELAGFLITMFMVPPGLITVTLGFFLFRFFDDTDQIVSVRIHAVNCSSRYSFPRCPKAGGRR